MTKPRAKKTKKKRRAPSTHTESKTGNKELEFVLEEICEALERNSLFFWDLETTGFNPFTRKVTGISFSVPDEMVPANCEYGCCKGELFPRSWYLPFVPERANHMSNEEALRRYPGVYYSVRQVFNRVRKYLEDPEKEKGGQNLKFDLKFTTKLGITVRGQIIDTCVASSLCDENRIKHGLKDIAYDYLGHEMTRFKELGGLFSPSIDVYGADDSCQSLRLWTEIFEPQLRREGLLKVFYELECRIVPILTYMELRGAYIDVPYLDDLDKYLVEERDKTEKEAYEAAGRRFQITSPDAVGSLLFDVLKWPRKGDKRTPKSEWCKTPTGLWKTDEATLTRYTESKRYGALAKSILKHRKIGKLKSTYVDTLRTDARALDGRVRSLFNQVHKPWEDKGGAVTGRFSSSRDEELGGLNFQNIPIRWNPYLGNVGSKIRYSIIAGPGNMLIVWDYSQIELRFMAHHSRDKMLLRAYRAWDCVECGGSGELRLVAHFCPDCGAPDGHRRKEDPGDCELCDASDAPKEGPTHGFCLGLDLHQMTADLCGIARPLGKTTNFLLLYGGQAKLLAQKAGISLKLAEKTHIAFFKAYPGIKSYHDRMIRQVMQKGYVNTILGRRRRFPHKRGRRVHPWEREWRQAVNHPIQGGAADLMKVAMRNVHERFDEENLLPDTGIILQVHDELVVEAPNDEKHLTYVAKLMQEEMEAAISGLIVPVVATGAIGKSWGEAK